MDDFIFYNLTIDLSEYNELANVVSMVEKPNLRNYFGVASVLKMYLSESSDISKYQPRDEIARSSLIESFYSGAKRTLSYFSKKDGADGDDKTDENKMLASPATEQQVRDKFEFRIWVTHDFEQLNLFSNDADFREFLQKHKCEPIPVQKIGQIESGGDDNILPNIKIK